jgi:L-ribulose-5-phosphate 4-epimerase
MTEISTHTELEIRSAVALAGRVLAANGHSDYIWGHVAVRDPHGRGFWMKASGQGFEEVTPDSVLLVTLDGEILAGDGRCHVEWPLHASIMAARPDVGATVHTHPPHAIGLAAADQPLRPLSHAGTLFVPPEVPRFTETANLVLTSELGDAVASTLGVQDAAFLVNHGIVTAGADVRSAVIRAVLLEDACRQQSVSGSFGGPAIWPSDQASLAKRRTVWSEAHLGQLWEYLARQLDQDPS